MQINVNQSRSHRQHKTKHSENKVRQEAQRTSPKKNHQTYPKQKKRMKKTKLAKAGETKEKFTVSDNDAAKTKQEIKTTPRSTNDLENSITFFISTKNKAYNTGCGQETPRC
jgi:hypothetical protein